MKELSPNQKAFADYYIETGNQTESAKRAGYKQPHVQGNRLLGNVRIKAYIKNRLDEIEDKRIATIEEVMRFYTSVMRGEVKDQFELDAELKDRLEAGKELMKRLEAIQGADDETGTEDDGFIAALNGLAGKDWTDEESD